MTLYKYLKPSRIDVIENLELRFTQPGALNDPFEFRPRFESLVSDEAAAAAFAAADFDLEPLFQKVYAGLPEEQRSRIPPNAVPAISAFLASPAIKSAALAAALPFFKHMMREQATLLRESVYNALNSRVGILSLSEVADHVLMWAHYADNHRGMVLAFDEAHAFFHRRRSPEDDLYYLRQVTYADVPPAPSALECDADSFLLTKGKQWSYEREWRILAPLEDATRARTVSQDVIYLYAFPTEALTAIFLGAKAEPDLREKVRQVLCSNPGLGHVRLWRAMLDLDNQRIRIA